MTITAYQAHQFARQCAAGRLTVAKGHLQAILHGYKGDFDQWAGKVEQCRLGCPMLPDERRKAQ